MYANVRRITFTFVIQQLIPILVFLFVTQTAPKTLGVGHTEALHKAAVEKVIVIHVFIFFSFFNPYICIKHASVGNDLCFDSRVLTT